jgi:hypothetical protein
MKGYVYLDNDNNLNVRDKHYIDVVDPLFWGRNAHLINIVWPFDSEDEECMLRILSSLRKFELKKETVSNFCLSIGFDLEAFLIKQRSNK